MPKSLPVLPRISKKHLLGLLFCLLLLGYLVFVAHQPPEAFFAHALLESRASSTVVVAGTSYQVVNGVLQDPGPSDQARQVKVLALAYALETAKKRPLFGLGGESPALLAQGASELDEVKTKLAAVQKTAQAKAEVEVLYPTSYLKTLATAEEARQRFLTSHTDLDYAAYARALELAALQGTKDAAALESALKAEVGTSSSKLMFAGGALSTQELLDGMKKTLNAFDTLQQALAARRECVSGKISSCTPADVKPILSPHSTTPRAATTTLALARQIQSIVIEAYGLTPNRPKLVALGNSACVGVVPGPYLFSTFSNGQVLFVGDLFFVGNASQGELGEYSSKRYGLTHFLSNPITFYECPDLLHDLNSIRATSAVADFAKSHPLLDTSVRGQLLGEVQYESDARAYLNDLLSTPALFDPLSPSDKQTLYDLAYTFAGGRGSLHQVVRQITDIQTSHLGGAVQGVPFNLDARTLVLLSSSFASLLSVEQPIIIMHTDASTNETYLSRYGRYSTLRESVPRDSIVKDLKSFDAVMHL